MSSDSEQLDELRKELEARKERIDALELRLEAIERETLTESLADATNTTAEEIENSIGYADDSSIHRTARKAILETIREYQATNGEAVPMRYIHGRLIVNYDAERIESAIETLRSRGEIYEPTDGHLKVV